MERSSIRVFVILLVGVGLIAATLVIRHNDQQKKHESKFLAAVIEADEHGAVTETDDGVIHGFSRDGKEVWRQSPQFVVVPGKGKTLRLTNGFCLGECPATFTNNVGAGRNLIVAHGIGGSAEPIEAGPPLDQSDVSVRGAVGADSLLFRRPAGSGAEYSFITPPLPGKTSKQISPVVKIGATTAVIALPSADDRRAMVIESGTTPGDDKVVLRWFQRAGSSWAQTGSAVRATKASACFSGDGERAALVGKQSYLIEFGGATRTPIALSSVGTSCTFSPDGITVTTNTSARSTVLKVLHFDKSGKRTWQRDFDHAASFNSRDGDNSIFQVTTKSATLFVDAATGKTTRTFDNLPAAFAAGSDVFIRADEFGKPTWLATR